MTSVLDSLAGRLIVSCQAYPGEPMLHPETMTQIAESVVRGGAAGIRAKGLDDLRLMRGRLDVPIIGLVKMGHQGVYITPTLRDCLDVAGTGCDVVAVDGTRRPRPDGRTLAETVAALRAEYPHTLVMADCGSAEDARFAEQAGVDIIGTTLAGYTGERPKTPGPDWEFIDQAIGQTQLPVFVEGRVHSPEDASMAIRRGATAVVVGTAITHPQTLASWFAGAVAQPQVKGRP